MDQEKTYRWVQDRLRDLHSGTLSEADRVQLFELAKHDPFLKDALEGFQSSSHHDHTPHLSFISHRIANKSIAKRLRLLPSGRNLVIQAVAASLVLILVSWAVVYYLGKENTTVFVSSETNTTVTDDRTDIQPRDMRDSDESTIAATEEGGGTEMSEEPSGLRAHAQSRAEKAKTVSPEEIVSTDAPTKEKDFYALSDVTFSQPAASPDSKAGEVEMKTSGVETQGAVTYEKSNVKRDEGYYANQMNPVMMAMRVTGQVIDAYGQPIPGAFLAIENSNLVTTSNPNGQFEIFLPEQNSNVEVSSTGYGDTTITVSQGKEDLVIMLAEHSPAEKMPSPGIVQDKATKLSVAGEKNNTMTFHEYLKINSRYPIQTNFTLSAKKVVIEFEINSSGRPDVIKSITTYADYKYAAEAIRLIKNGPDWVCGDVDPCMMTYTIYFQ